MPSPFVPISVILWHLMHDFQLSPTYPIFHQYPYLGLRARPNIWFSHQLAHYGHMKHSHYRGGSRIWLMGGSKFFWPIFANSAANEVSPYWLGSRACLRALEALGFSLLNMHSLHFWIPFYTNFEIIKY